MNTGEMENPLYPIGAVSKLTGIGLHTLRAWERRYGVVTPVRDDRGRLYTKGDIERLLLLNDAVANGHAIGRLASLTDSELRELAPGPRPATAPIQHRESGVAAPCSLVEAVSRLDHAAAERELALIAAVMPPRELIYRVALPLLREIGEGWHAGTATIAQEHMTSSLLRNLFGGLISRYHRSSASVKLLFATPPGERHDFGLIISAMLAAAGGLGIVYLGSELPGNEIVSAARETAVRAVLIGFVGSGAAKDGAAEVIDLAEKLPIEIELWVGGTKDKSAAEKVRGSRALLIENFELLERHLVRLGSRF